MRAVGLTSHSLLSISSTRLWHSAIVDVITFSSLDVSRARACTHNVACLYQ